MACEKCKHIVDSGSEMPFMLSGIAVNEKFYVCPVCHRHYFQHSVEFHLWQELNESEYNAEVANERERKRSLLPPFQIPKSGQVGLLSRGIVKWKEQ